MFASVNYRQNGQFYALFVRWRHKSPRLELRGIVTPRLPELDQSLESAEAKRTLPRDLKCPMRSMDIGQAVGGIW
jgi:hypothetical protein